MSRVWVHKSGDLVWHLAKDFRNEDADTACGLLRMQWAQAAADGYVGGMAEEARTSRRCLACMEAR